MDLLNIKTKLKKVFSDEQASVLEEYFGFLSQLVKVDDFNELKNIVKEIVEIQKETKNTLNELSQAQKQTEIKLKELAEAQKKTEIKLEELAEAQKKTEIKLEELAEAQKKTEIKLEELAEAQKKTEIKLEELAEAQKKTEQELKALAEEHKKTRHELGGLSHTVGYVLEDRAYVGLPKLLQKEFNIQIIQPFKRQSIRYKGNQEIEVNILAKGKKHDKELWIIGEAKSQLKKKHVDEFINKQHIYNQIFPGDKMYILVTYMTRKDVEEYAHSKNIEIFYSYEFPL